MTERELKSIEDLQDAPYNPRSISGKALQGLAYSLEKFGDISGIVWNKRTGHLVCGHQRVKALREKYGDDLILAAPGTDAYDIDTQEVGIWAKSEFFPIRVVDWDEDMELAANVAANAPTIAGSFTADIEEIVDQIERVMPDTSDLLMLREIEFPDKDEDDDDDGDKGKDDSIPAMELQPYESYDYVVILCRTTMDWEWLCEKLKIQRVNASPIAGKKKIGLGRAIPVERLMALFKGNEDGDAVHPVRGEG